eukprot:4056273-Prymnesium_polylepis.1
MDTWVGDLFTESVACGVRGEESWGGWMGGCGCAMYTALESFGACRRRGGVSRVEARWRQQGKLVR